MQKFHQYFETEAISMVEKTELECYYDDGYAPKQEGFDILNWWKVHQPKYPILSKIAKDFLTILVSKDFGKFNFITNNYSNN